MTTTLAAERTQLRTYMHDNADDHFVRAEDVGSNPLNVGMLEAGSAIFYLMERGIVTASVEVVKDGLPPLAFPGGGEGINLPDGKLTFSATSKPQKSLLVFYKFQWFLDDDLDAFLTDAVRWLQWYATDITSVPDGLIPAVLHYAVHLANMRLFQRYSEMYDVTVEGRTANKSTIPQRYLDAAGRELEEAKAMRASWGTGSDRASKPFTTMVVRPYPGYTPRR